MQPDDVTIGSALLKTLSRTAFKQIQIGFIRMVVDNLKRFFGRRSADRLRWSLSAMTSGPGDALFLILFLSAGRLVLDGAIVRGVRGDTTVFQNPPPAADRHGFFWNQCPDLWA